MAADLTEIGDRFAVVQRAAKGGMGVVYKAKDRQTGAVVAVKVLHRGDSDSVARFEREAEILARLAHPGIVRYIAHGTTADGAPYLAMDWVEGETLHTRLQLTGVSVGEALDVGRRVAGALGYAHERGVVHRDVKPSNLILPDRELSRVAVVDFGVARVPSAGSLTLTGALVGTPAYMAPEQARGDRALGPGVDVFALGCVLYECTTGRRAFEGKHVLALLAKIALWEPPRPSTIAGEIPPALDDAIMKMLAKDPAKRPRDGNEVVALLSTIVADSGSVRRAPAEPSATLVQPARAAPRRRLASIVVATPPAAADGSEIAIDPAWLAAIPALDGDLPDVHLEKLRDGSLLAAITGPPAGELADRAIRCARAIRHRIPDALIAIATGDIGDGDALAETIDSMLEDAVGALAREAMALLFAAVTTPARPSGAIRVDERTAKLLPADAVVRVKTTCYVQPDSTVSTR